MLVITALLTWKLLFHVFLPELQGNHFLSASREERELLRMEISIFGNNLKRLESYRLPQQSHRDLGSSLGSRKVESLITRLSFTVRTGEKRVSLDFFSKRLCQKRKEGEPGHISSLESDMYFILRKWHVNEMETERHFRQRAGNRCSFGEKKVIGRTVRDCPRAEKSCRVVVVF